VSNPTAADYRALLAGLVRRMVLVSVLPLLVIGGTNYYLFYHLNRSIVLEQHGTLLRNHKESIETFLDGLTTQLSTIAHQYSLAELQSGDLERILRVVQLRDSVFTDVGVIDSQGRHLKYVGPFDLAGRNYRDAVWFRQAVANGVHVSDVFLGFRGVPHFVIAVRRVEGDSFWILRATVNTDYFSKLVDAAHVGRTGETFLVNRDGLLQTKTRLGGALLSPSGFPWLDVHDDIRVREAEMGGKRYLCSTTWLQQAPWLVVFRQEQSEVFAPLRKASLLGVATFLAGAAGAVLIAMAVARRQVRHVMRVDREKAALADRLLVAGKTAALGEMSAGLAHEINNPLATIDTIQTWIRDLAGTGPIAEADREEILDSAAKIGEQVVRCKAVTQGLLKFSRRVESRPEEMDLGQLLGDLVAVARARARVDNVELDVDLAPLPRIVSTPAHLQQVFLNIVNNAIDAASERAPGRVLIRARTDPAGVRVEVADNGPGISPENLSRIFLPFFTTKPVGKGTGLGLAICYGLVHDLGGAIHVESKPGAGATFAVTLPRRAPPRESPPPAPEARRS
jgi:two-component system NtrC family sensor kinase